MTDTITLPREVLERALAALFMYKPMVTGVTFQHGLDAMQELRAALEQAQIDQEPVAYCVASGSSPFQIFRSKSQAESLACDLQRRHDLAGSPAHFHVIPLYTHPQNLNCKSTQARLATLWGYEKSQPPRQPLTDEAEHQCPYPKANPSTRNAWLDGWEAAERAHGIGGEA